MDFKTDSQPRELTWDGSQLFLRAPDGVEQAVRYQRPDMLHPCSIRKSWQYCAVLCCAVPASKQNLKQADPARQRVAAIYLIIMITTNPYACLMTFD